MDLSSINIAAVIQEAVAQSKTLIGNFIRSRFLLQSSLYQTNELQQQAVQQIIAGIQVNVAALQNAFSLQINFLKKGPYFNIMFGGQGSEVLGGSGGTIHLPNGGTARSKVSEHLWGTTTDIYARDAIDMQKIEQMATKFFTDAIEEAVSASEEQISNAVASYVNEKLCTGGG